MPWKCPACQTQIRHDTDPAEPSPGVVYRCHVCRLELVYSPQTHKLVLAPITPPDSNA